MAMGKSESVLSSYQTLYHPENFEHKENWSVSPPTILKPAPVILKLHRYLATVMHKTG